MDGVLFRGGTPLPGANEFLGFLHTKGIGYMLTTNNSTLTPEANAERLAGMGIRVSSEAILTSSMATADYLTELDAAGERALVIGEDGLKRPLTAAGIRVVDDYRDTQWVVTGLDRAVTYDHLRNACLALERGARFVATNADTSLPVEEGLVPGAGAIQAALTATTGIQPTVIGKPEPRMLLSAMRTIDADPSGTAVLGDRLDTDIQSAQRAGLRSILVLTGVTTADDLKASATQPTRVVTDLPELMASW